MPGRLLTLAEVLREEFTYVAPDDALNLDARTRDDGTTSPTPWRFRRRDIYDPRVFLTKIARAQQGEDRPGTNRYALMVEPIENLYAKKIDKLLDDAMALPDGERKYAENEMKNQLAKAMNSLLDRRKFSDASSSEDLFQRLLRYPDFAAIVRTDRRLLRVILTTPSLRAHYVESETAEARQRLDGLVQAPNQLTDVVDDSAVLVSILSYSEVANAVLSVPELFGTLIDSRAIRDALSSRTARRRLAASYAPRSSWWSARTIRQKEDFRRPAVDREAVLCAVTGNTRAEHPPVAEPSEERANALMLEAAYRDHLHDHLDEKVVLDRMQQANLTALCLSGGGIRSATFSLGVLQGLARRGLLSKVDYLSTVSGGGYIGSWLSSWMRRHDHGAEGVFDELAGASADPLKPEPEPIHHLREYSNYLAPRFAAFSPDLWTIAATYARNLLLVWLIILPPLLAVLMLPRAYEWWLLNPFEAQLPDYFTIHVSQVASWTNIGVGYFTTLDKSPGAWLKVAWLFLFLAMVALSLIRPVGEYVPGKEKSISEIRKARGQIWWFISFGFVATFALAMSWARYRPTEVKHTDATNLVFNRAWWLFLFANVLGSLCYLGRHYSALRVTDDPALNALARARKPLKLFKFLRILATRPVLLPKVLLEFAGTAAAAAVAASVLWLIARGPLGSDLSHPTAGAFGSSEAFAILGIPLLLLTLFIEATFLIGIVTIVSSDFEREWWARAAALVFLIGIGWIGVTSIALIGPALITQSPKVIAALGGISAIATVAVGYRDKSSPKAKKSTIVTIGLTPAAAIATLITLSALSLLNGRIVAPTPCQEASKQVRSDVVVRASMVAPAGYALHVEKKTAPSSAMDRILDFGQQTRCHIWVLRHTNWNWFWGSMGGAFLLSLLAGWLLDVNTYSMHSMYRNRLIRAYLGASRWLRRPDPFTGFDPQDNLQMYQLLPDYLWACSFADFDNFLLELPRSKLWSILPVRVRSRISEFVARPNDAREAERKDLYGVVFGTINQCMGGLDFETGQPAETTAATLHRNRAYLKKTFGSFLRQQPKRPPLHILNMALNLVAGDNLAWQERKAESFTVSPLHSGSAATDRLGFRDSAEYGGAKGISLGTAMAISGAAVSPNMGYHSSAPVTFMMTLFNARLGWWLGNPGPKGDATYRQKGPAFSLGPLLSEAFARTNDDARYIFLSDGGHFENLGLYEMVRRRCRSIIVCDAASDPKYWFGELGNAVRKIRIDFGIPIDFEAFCIGPDPETPEKRREAAYCALGTIRYSCVRIARDEVRDQDSDEDGRGDGHLIYIKPAVYSDCSVDVVNYSRAGKPFPQQTTVDQFFDETQFESYRELGSHIISKISRGQRGDLTAEQFYTQALKYLRKHGGKHAC